MQLPKPTVIVACVLLLVGFLFFAPDNYTLMKSDMELQSGNEGIWKLNKRTGRLEYCRINHSSNLLVYVKEL